MDWIGIVIFIIFIVFKAMGESNKQKRQKEARQQQGAPLPGRTIPKPVQKSPPPVTMPDWGFPSMFPFFEEEEVVKPVKPKKVAEQVKKAVADKSASPPQPSVATPRAQRSSSQSVEEFGQRGPEGFSLEQAQLGIIYSEILSPPRALRPYRTRSYRS